ncbi:glycosyltransferase [Gramella sp. KN1008]|uniref:glycosyltransferase n=1 Tax=Gramella sp. KN1008 TaxID=2529298 RepID=UPI00103B9FD6|nr:glycosyltransferase [Gramella sp. KN1008]TBW30122.1 glycosyltransferase [Gramella sp. KN1008]
MEIYVWQLKPSMHQLNLVKGLKKISSTYLIFQEENLATERKAMGWNDDGLKPDFLLERKEDMTKFIYSLNSSSYHLFGGFKSSPELIVALKLCIKLKMKVYVQSEASDYFGLKGKLRVLLDKWKVRKMKDQISGVFAIGTLGVNYFNLIGFDKNKIFPFGYFMNFPKKIDKSRSKLVGSNFQLIFVGRLIKQKGVLQLLKALRFVEGNWHLTIIGNGPEESNLKAIVCKDTKLKERVKFENFMNNKKVLIKIRNSDLLVLPSIGKEGWGAVVSESLMQGIPAVVTEKCGSSMLLNNSNRGEIVRANSKESLSLAIASRVQKGKLDSNQKSQIIQWANCLSGDMAAKYVIDTMLNKKPINPWVN